MHEKEVYSDLQDGYVAPATVEQPIQECSSCDDCEYKDSSEKGNVLFGTLLLLGLSVLFILYAKYC